VRNALVWLGEPDPNITMEKTRAEDPEIQTYLDVMNEWLDVIGNTADVTVKTVIDYATEREDSGTPPFTPTFTHPGFREALLIVASEGGNISSRRLGKWLAKKKGRVINNQRIVQAGARGHAVRWRVEFVNE
jgi:putative DNA primase/helicase